MYTSNKIIQFQVVDIMKTNVERVLERDQKLSELDDRAGKYISCLCMCCDVCLHNIE